MSEPITIDDDIIELDSNDCNEASKKNNETNIQNVQPKRMVSTSKNSRNIRSLLLNKAVEPAQPVIIQRQIPPQIPQPVLPLRRLF